MIMELKTDIETKIEEAITLFSEVLIVDKSFFKERGRTFPLSSYRSIAIMFCRNNIIPKPSLKELGRAFDRDHSTIVRSINVGENEVNTNKHMAAVYKKALDKFKKKEYKMKNSVLLLDYMGSDKSHSLAAWASTFMELDIPVPKDHKIRVDQIVDHILSKSKRMRSIDGLLEYLAVENHESPFRMSSFLFGMTTEIATHIQKLKHTVLLEAENAESAKYKELQEDKFYMPEDWLEYGATGAKWYDELERTTNEANDKYHQCFYELKEAGMPLKRVKESSRFFKTYNSQINSVNKFSFAGVIQFHNKRSVDFAQNEIKDIAKGMIDEIRNIEGDPFKNSLKAFGY